MPEPTDPMTALAAAAVPGGEKFQRAEYALHVLRFALDRFTRAKFKPDPEYLRYLIDRATDDPGERCDRDEQYARAEKAEATIARVRAASARIRGVTRTWEPVADLIDAALDGTDQPTGCSCHNIDELCSGCHRCPDICNGCDGPERPIGAAGSPVIATARIALDVQPGLAGGIASVGLADGIVLPAVEFDGADVLPLKGTPMPARLVLTGDEQARFTVDGKRYATSTEHPVVVEPLGPGAEGGLVTFTLIANKVTVNGREVNDVRR